jgi:hypothetical protein
MAERAPSMTLLESAAGPAKSSRYRKQRPTISKPNAIADEMIRWIGLLI